MRMVQLLISENTYEFMKDCADRPELPEEDDYEVGLMEGVNSTCRNILSDALVSLVEVAPSDLGWTVH